MSQCIYGGKIDNEFDQRLLTAFVNKLFTKKSFDRDFTLVTMGQSSNITMPEGIRSVQGEVVLLYMTYKYIFSVQPPTQWDEFVSLPV